MAAKKPMKLGDDPTDFNLEQFGPGDQAQVDGVINPSGNLTLQDASTGPHNLSALVDDKKVKVSSNDTTANYLLSKLQAGANIAVSEVNDGGDEKVQISTSGLETFGFKQNFSRSGSANDKWLKRDTDHSEATGPNDDEDATPWVTPYGGQIVALGFMNKKLDCHADIEIYKNGTLVYTLQIRTKKWVTKSDFSAISFSAGDRISVFARKVNREPDTVLVDVFVKFTSLTAQELSGVTA